MLNIPLMSNNIDKSDIDVLVNFLQNTNRFTNGPIVREFEARWSDWIGMKYSVFVNSGSSANFISLATVRELYGVGGVLLSPIGWSSDVSAVIAAGMTPVFVDVDFSTFAMNEEAVISRLNSDIKAVLLTHVLGHDGMSDRIRNECNKRGIVLIEDTCESHGATHNGKKCGSIGDISNFSFYYAHHMSTIEGGMICTNDEKMYNIFRMFRSHGMLRECDDKDYIDRVSEEHSDLHPEFIFTVPGYNMRSTELNAVIGLNQLKRLDSNIEKRRKNYHTFLTHLDPTKYFTEFKEEGSSNYAFIVLLRQEYIGFFDKLINTLRRNNVEFRRGTAGGGNLTRQPFVKKLYPDINPEDYHNADYIHRYGLYTGNYPDLEESLIIKLCEVLNTIG